MSDWPLGYTALRIAKLFAESTAEKRCCADITKQLNVPQQTVWNALHSMEQAQILTAKKEWMPKQKAKMVYELTAQGWQSSVAALAAVRFEQPTILISS